MKKQAYLVLMLTAASLTHAQGAEIREWRITLKVVDDAGVAVTNAEAWVAHDDPKQGQSSDPFQPNDWAVAGRTDETGTFIAAHSATAKVVPYLIGLHARKTG